MLYNKAIRDKIPQIIAESGKTCNVKELSDDEFLDALEQKLSEEVLEYQKDLDVGELADVLEVVFRIAELRGISKQQLEQIRIDKTQKRGAFENNLFLIDSK